MYSDRMQRHWFPLAVMVLAVIAIFLWEPASVSGSRDLQEEGAVALKAAVERCALQCYVVEGAYPASLSYLEEHYGLQVNREDYYVMYEIFASNIPPEVQVLDRVVD